MSNDTKSTELMCNLIIRADRFASSGHPEAALILLYTARRAIHSPQPTAPIHHYILDLRQALIIAFGHESEIGNLSTGRMLDALYNWLWFADLTGAYIDPTIRAAIGILGSEATWSTRKEACRAVLLGHPYNDVVDDEDEVA